MNRERCEHATYPVEVLHVDGGKKRIAYCPGCGRSAPVCEGSMEAVIALRAIPHLATALGPPAEKIDVALAEGRSFPGLKRPY
jgi:hypothetical protein